MSLLANLPDQVSSEYNEGDKLDLDRIEFAAASGVTKVLEGVQEQLDLFEAQAILLRLNWRTCTFKPREL